MSRAETNSDARADEAGEKSGTLLRRDRCGAERKWREQRPKRSSDKHEDVPAGEPQFEVDQGLASSTRGAVASGDDGGGQVRSTIGANSGWGAGTAAGEEIIEGVPQGGGLSPGPTEGDDSAAVDQVGGGGQTAICPLHAASKVIDQYRPRYALFALVVAGVLKLLLARPVPAVSLAGVGLTDEHFHELHLLAVEQVQLLHRCHTSSRDGACVTHEVEKHRLSAEVAQLHGRTVGGRKLEIRRLAARQEAGAEKFRDHVPHAEVLKVEILAWI